MARYGESAENFNRETAALEAAMKARKGVAAAEAELTGALDSSSSALDRATAKTRLYRKAKEEADAFAQRSAQVEGATTRNLDLETAAIERNTAARRRAASASAGALAGARDPLFGQAHGLADPTTGVSQYELRRQLGVGSARASRLQEAIGAGYRPAAPGVAYGAATRAEAAQSEVVAADIARARAQREYTAAVRRDDQAAAEVAAADVAAANARKASAKAELESSAKEQAARTENAAAIQQEAATRRRASGPGTALIEHPTLFGQQAYAPISQPDPVARTPVSEYPLRYGGGNVAYDAHSEGQRNASAANAQAAATRAAANEAQSLRLAEAHLEESRLSAVLDTQAASAERVGRAYRASGVELSTASQQLTRHGALTSEFITAAFKGQTTIRELGNQALITAGKFGAWTLAATGVYGAVRAVGSIGKGAIDAQSGVHQLTRVVNDVNPETASKSFSDLAGQFNVPIKDTSDAVYRMGQVFHGQADAVNAAKAALYSYTTGEVDVATSTKNLIAIQRGSGASSKDLLKIYDQINQAQNTFGIAIGDTEAGLAKSIGTFTNAGGSLNYLLGLFVAISKATGRSGTEIGTGIARAANQIRKPKSQETLKALGVDVDPNNLQTTLQSAIATARKPGADYNAIAAGVFGNQYARLLSPVLRDPSTLTSALKGTSPEASKDSAKIEFAKTRNQVDFQIRELGVSMQRIGEGLARAGAFSAAGGFLKILNETLHLANGIVNVFDRLPEPLRHALALLGEMYITMKLLQRFGVADAVGSRLGFQGSRDRSASGLVLKGLEGGQVEAVNARERIARQAQAAETEAQFQRRIANQTGTQYRARERAGTLPPIDSEDRAALRAELEATERKAVAAEQQALELQLKANAAREEVVLYEQDVARYKKLEAEQGAKAALADAEQRGYYRPADHNQPSSTGAVPVGAQRYGIDNETGQRVPLGATEADMLTVGGRPPGIGPQANTSLNRLERGIAPYTGSLRAWGAQMDDANKTGGILKKAADTAAGAADRGAAVIGGAGGGLKNLGTRLGAFVGTLGALDIALVGFLAFAAVNAVGNKLIEDQNKALDGIEGPQNNLAQAKAVQKRAYDIGAKRDTGSGVGGYLGHVGQNINYGAANFADAITGRAFSSNYENAADREARLKAEAAQAQDEYNRILGLQNTQRRKGRNQAVPLQFYGQITKEMAQEQKQRIAGVISEREFDKLLAKNALEIKTGRGDQGSRNRALAELADMKRANAKPTDFQKRYSGLALPDLVKELQGSATLAQEGNQVGLHFREMAYLYEQIRQQVGTQHDTKALTALLQARKALFQGIEDTANTELQTSLKEATNQGEKNAAYQQAARTLNRLPDAARKQLGKDQGAQDAARKQLAKDQATQRLVGVPRLGTLGPGGVSVNPLDPLSAALDNQLTKGLREQIKKDNEKINKLGKAVKGDQADLDAAIKERHAAKLQLRDDAYASRQAGRQTELAYTQSLTYDKGAQDAEAIRSAASDVADAARTYGAGSDQWKQAMTALNNARHNANNYIQDNASAENALITARASGDPTGRSQAQAAITVAQNAYNAAARDPKLAGQDRVNQLKNLSAGIISAQLAYAQYLQQQADALAAARFTLAESRTTDPVKRAQIEVKAARDAIARARTPADKLTARANYNDKQNALIAARVTAREDTIDFDLTMGKITRDQAIAELQSLLKTHGLTQQMRRDVLRKIKQLRDDSANAASGFDLDIGNIKLPTIYDVRRAIGGLKGAGDHGSRAQFNNKINVKVEVTDPKAARRVYEALDQAMGTSIASGMRQAGLTL